MISETLWSSFKIQGRNFRHEHQNLPHISQRLKANHVCMMGNPISGKISRFYPVPTRGHLFTMLRFFFVAFIDKVPYGVA